MADGKRWEAASAKKSGFRKPSGRGSSDRTRCLIMGHDLPPVQRHAMSDGDVKGAKLSIVLRHMETPDALAVLEPLWNALRDHHSSILPRLGGETPSRPP